MPRSNRCRLGDRKRLKRDWDLGFVIVCNPSGSCGGGDNCNKPGTMPVADALQEGVYNGGSLRWLRAWPSGEGWPACCGSGGPSPATVVASRRGFWVWSWVSSSHGRFLAAQESMSGNSPRGTEAASWLRHPLWAGVVGGKIGNFGQIKRSSLDSQGKRNVAGLLKRPAVA